MSKELEDYDAEALEKAIVATDVLNSLRDHMTVRLAADLDAFRLALSKALGDRGGSEPERAEGA